MSSTECPCGGVCPCHEAATKRSAAKRKRDGKKATDASRARVQLYRARRSGWVCSKCGVPVRKGERGAWTHAASPNCGQKPKAFQSHPNKRPPDDDRPKCAPCKGKGKIGKAGDVCTDCWGSGKSPD